MHDIAEGQEIQMRVFGRGLKEQEGCLVGVSKNKRGVWHGVSKNKRGVWQGSQRTRGVFGRGLKEQEGCLAGVWSQLSTSVLPISRGQPPTSSHAPSH